MMGASQLVGSCHVGSQADKAGLPSLDSEDSEWRCSCHRKEAGQVPSHERPDLRDSGRASRGQLSLVPRNGVQRPGT